MAEYIEREAINRICFMDYFLVDGEVRTESVALVRDIEKLPAADVAPVVYCRECKRSGLTEFGKRYCSEPMGAFAGCIPVEDDSFCSGGKRREDAHAQD